MRFPGFVFLWRAAVGLVAFLVLSQSAFAQAVPGCGNLRPQGQYGPYDHRKDAYKADSGGGTITIVTGAHFDAGVEALIKGMRTTLGGDIDYTLRALPNYHRALVAVMRLGEREKTDKPANMSQTVDCYFKRAVAFAPDDAIVRMIYSTYLLKRNRIDEASLQLDTATTHAKDNGFTHYNLGLHYFDLKNFDKALSQAHRAMELGWDHTVLKDQLVAAGKWVEPALPAQAAPEPSGPASAPAGPQK